MSCICTYQFTHIYSYKQLTSNYLFEPRDNTTFYSKKINIYKLNITKKRSSELKKMDR